MNIKGSKTEHNLADAFAAEAQAQQRYRYFAIRAEVEGHHAIAKTLHALADNEGGHAQGHLDCLLAARESATAPSAPSTRQNLCTALEHETNEHTNLYAAMAQQAHDEGLAEVAVWFEAVAKAARAHAERLEKALATLDA